jgi:error-prone DNA polymerase
LKRRQGREPVDYLHPSLEPVLARTLGVPLFQEQLLRMAMIAAGFTGGEAEELRRAFGFKRSEVRMKSVEQKLRIGMERNKIGKEVQDKIVQSIVSFALYGFPESHAASFALIAYASAYLKCHYLAAFTAAILNNQPMGFYQPATLVKDAQRHGLKVRPIDVTRSDWFCTLEKDGQDFALRIGMRYVHGLRAEIAQEIMRERAVHPFLSIDDLKLRVPAIQKAELTMLAQIGALNFIAGKSSFHRRDALWQVERAARRAGPLLEKLEQSKEPGEEAAQEENGEEGRGKNEKTEMPAVSPLQPMSPEERLIADFSGTSMTVGPHPLRYHRKRLDKQGVRSANELSRLPNGMPVRIAGAVIARQRPGTAKGFVFLSLEDETGIANAIVTPQTYEKYHLIIVHQQFLIIEGELQNQQNVISVKAEIVWPLSIARVETGSHDFH